MVEENTQLRAEVTEFQVGDCFCFFVWLSTLIYQLPAALFINSRNDARKEIERQRESTHARVRDSLYV